MEDNSTEVVDISIKKLHRSPLPFSTSSSSFSSVKSRVEHIAIFFVCKKIVVDWYEDGDFSSQEQQPSLNIVEVSASRVFNTETIYKTIKRELRDWDLSNSLRERLINDVIRSIQERPELISSEHNVLDVHVEVNIKQHRIFSLSDTNLMIQQSIEETGPSMVPATDSSIESLEKKILSACDVNGTNCESCRVCFEDFLVGCEVTCMPCSHVFHGDCIAKWLRTNHYCPLCRQVRR